MENKTRNRDICRQASFHCDFKLLTILGIRAIAGLLAARKSLLYSVQSPEFPAIFYFMNLFGFNRIRILTS